MSFRSFPKGFFWGCATSAHQIEGGNRNDWSEWESSPERLKALKEKGQAHEEFLSGNACESYVQENADIDCLRQLGANAYRFSIEWSRIEPEEEKWDEEAIAHYRDFILKLKSHGMEPFVTLWHWPIPLWVRDQGGWASSKTAKDFGRFTERMVQELQGVKFWITLNEPQVYLMNSYVTGEWPPQKKSPLLALRVGMHLMRGHKEAYRAIKRHTPEAQVGISTHHIHFSAEPHVLLNDVFAHVASFFWNHLFLLRIRAQQDFIGVNYYFTHRLSLGLDKKKHGRLYSDIGWELRPEGVRRTLLSLSRYKKPLYITEHGLADKEDQHRSWYLTESLREARKAIDAGVDLRGYLHWSLLDNFEWAMGFHPRFGLFEVNRQTCERIPRPSVQIYREIIQKNGVDE